MHLLIPFRWRFYQHKSVTKRTINLSVRTICHKVDNDKHRRISLFGCTYLTSACLFRVSSKFQKSPPGQLLCFASRHGKGLLIDDIYSVCTYLSFMVALYRSYDSVKTYMQACRHSSGWLVAHHKCGRRIHSCMNPMQKGVSLFLSYTNMNKMNSLHHMKEYPKISNFLQFESHSSKCVKVRAISDLRYLYGNKIQGLPSLAFMFYVLFKFQ